MLIHLVEWLANRTRDDKGATMVEYGLLVVLIALVAAAGATFLGTQLRGLFNQIGNMLGTFT